MTESSTRLARRSNRVVLALLAQVIEFYSLRSSKKSSKSIQIIQIFFIFRSGDFQSALLQNITDAPSWLLLLYHGRIHTSCYALLSSHLQTYLLDLNRFVRFLSRGHSFVSLKIRFIRSVGFRTPTGRMRLMFFHNGFCRSWYEVSHFL